MLIGQPAEERVGGAKSMMKAGGPAVPSHHSPLFKVQAEESVLLGVEATVIALKNLLQVIAK